MIKFKNEAKELNPNQDLKINAGLIHMWKKAGLRVKSFKATKKGYNEIWAGKFKTKNATLEMSVNKYGDVFYHAGNKSVNIGRLDKQRKIIDWMKAIIRNSPWSESVNEAKKKVNIASLSVGNTYKDSKGYPVKIIDIGGSGSSWKITYKDGHGKKKTVRTSLSKGINLYEFIREYTEGDVIHAKTKSELKKALGNIFKQLSNGKQPRHDIINGMSGEYIGLRMKDGGYELISSAIQSAMRELK